MPIMPRPKKAQKISDKVMKKSPGEDKPVADRSQRSNREPIFDRDVRTMIKR